MRIFCLAIASFALSGWLLLGCDNDESGSDTGPTGDADIAPLADADAGVDAPADADAGADVGSDTGLDAEAGLDAAADTGADSDGGLDADEAPDGGETADADGSIDRDGDTASDASPRDDAETGAGADGGADAEVESDAEAAPDAEVTPDAEAAPDAEMIHDAEAADAFTLSSTDFTDGASIPAANACASDFSDLGFSPALAWTNVPEGTLSFALTMIDVDAGDFLHWAIGGFDGSLTSLLEDTSPTGPLPAGAWQIDNDFSQDGYGGPCPPPGGPHTYVFTLYALDEAYPDPGDIDLAAFQAFAASHSLGEATLSGIYESYAS